ncbi:MAG: murein biosynthesis integral membrane protein MurJ [Candidatus Omnitrophica bacterium]|nr:murein biosynthesis integral membrane protein MurJ [Candidatus Omnitrophota bacterium]
MLKRVIKNTYILGLGTLASRILGFIRDVLIANFFGTTGILEAFIVSFRLPNIFRSVFGEGFSDSVATPILSEYQDNKDRMFEIGNHLISLFIVILFVATVLGIIFAKFLVTIIAPGFLAESFKFNLAVSFTRITFIYLFFIGLSANITSILYALKKFFVPAINPAFLNISFIVGIIFFSRSRESYILVICVLVAGLFQLIFPFIFLKKEGFHLRFNLFKSLRSSEVIRMLKLFIPRVWSSIVYHLSVFIDTIFSSLVSIVGQGALASVYYANRLIQLPFALIALSISRVAIVDLSSYHHEGNMDDFKKLFVFSFQNIIFFIIPLVSFFLFASKDIIDVIFTRGKFDINSLNMTASVLFFYSFGLFFFCGIKLLVNSFYALKDTAFPAKTATISLVINIILSAALMYPLKIGGVALGSSLAAAFNFGLLYYWLIRRIGKIDFQNTKTQFLKILFLSVTIGVTARILLDSLFFNKYINMLIVIISLLVIFIVGGYILGIKQINYLKKWALKRK